MLKLMKPDVASSNIFSLVEQLLKLSHPPELETEVSFPLTLCATFTVLLPPSSPLSVAFSTKAELILHPVGYQDLFSG